MKRMGDLIERTETANPSQYPEDEFQYVDVSSVSNQTFEIEETQKLLGKDAPSRARKSIKSGDILFATIRPTLQRIATIPENLHNQVCSTAFVVLRPKSGIEGRFLFYSLLSPNFSAKMSALQKGASYPAVTDGEVKDQLVAVPPLPEQQRIVAILDEAFEAIATAKANTEKNLQNARALLDGHSLALLTSASPSWSDCTIGDQITLQRGYDITKDHQVNGDVPVVSSGGIKSFHNQPMAKAPGVIIGRKGTLGKVFYVDVDFWPHDTTLYVRNFGKNLPRYVYHFLKSLPVSHLDTGTANPALNRNIVHSIAVSWPPPEEQQSIVDQLDALTAQTERLATIYAKRLGEFESLKTSLLHQAFTGNL